MEDLMEWYEMCLRMRTRALACNEYTFQVTRDQLKAETTDCLPFDGPLTHAKSIVEGGSRHGEGGAFMVYG